MYLSEFSVPLRTAVTAAQRSKQYMYTANTEEPTARYTAVGCVPIVIRVAVYSESVHVA